MRSHWSEQVILYDGSQLRAHWILQRFGLVGDSIVGFRGACNVRREEIADLADMDGPGIAAADMVHFVWECFTSPDLLLATHRQRLLTVLAREVLDDLAPVDQVTGSSALTRKGDDLFVGSGKLSISIATVTPVSALIHFAVNASPGGAPVQTATLAELSVDPAIFSQRLLQRVVDEQQSIADARAKVRAKGEWQ